MDQILHSDRGPCHIDVYKRQVDAAHGVSFPHTFSLCTGLFHEAIKYICGQLVALIMQISIVGIRGSLTDSHCSMDTAAV